MICKFSFTHDDIYYQATGVIQTYYADFVALYWPLTSPFIINKHTFVDLFCSKWTSFCISGSAFDGYCSEKSILTKQIKDSIYLHSQSWEPVKLKMYLSACEVKDVLDSLLSVRQYYISIFIHVNLFYM